MKKNKTENEDMFVKISEIEKIFEKKKIVFNDIALKILKKQ